MIRCYKWLLPYLFLGGCSLFDTTPPIECRYLPPTSNAGLLCVMTCRENRTLCRQNKEQEYEQCRQRERIRELKRENCELRRDEDAGLLCFPDEWEHCWSPSYRECLGQYNECYQSCGGTVEAYVPGQ